MKLLILTQKVDKNDDVLGFFHGWIAEFAKHCEKVTVIALGVGEHDLPRNVKVLSLGKEQNNFQFSIFNFQSIFNSQIFKKLIYTLNFYKYIWQERKNYDNVFVHMNPEYVVLGGILWRLWGKKIGLWYMHKSVNLKLRLAEKLTHIIFSATPESFRLKSKKLNVTGHGIPSEKLIKSKVHKVDGKNFDVICVGRISPIKNQKVLVEGVNILVNEMNLKDLKVALVGGGSSKEDDIYLKEIIDFVEKNNLQNNVKFLGNIPNNEIVSFYNQSKISINLCPTGGMDKVVLESMLCEVPVIAFNKTFEGMLGDENLILKNLDKNELANKILEWLQKSEKDRNEIGLRLREKVVKNHSLKKLIVKILNLYHA